MLMRPLPAGRGKLGGGTTEVQAEGVPHHPIALFLLSP